MNIIIVGCGKMGSTLTSVLVAEGHNVVVIDSSESVITDITNTYDAMGVVGNGVDYDTLKEAGAENTELLVAMTSKDEFNMLSCFLARKMGVKHTIARIRAPEYNNQNTAFLKQQLDISMIVNPDFMAANEILNTIKLPTTSKIESFSRGNFDMIELKLRENSPFNGVQLKNIHNTLESRFLIGVVQRNDQIIVPDGNFTMNEKDTIGILASRSELIKLLGELGLQQKAVSSVILLGASRLSYYLGRMLIANKTTVKIIERDIEKCEEFAELLPEAVVIHGDGMNQDILTEEGINEANAFVALTGEDEENILISIFAKSRGVPKVVTKVNQDQMIAMAENLGLECIISPKKTVSNVAQRYARALENSIGSKIETMYKLMDGKAEALEFIVNLGFEQSEVPLKDLKFKPNTLVGGIVRGRKIMIPTGSDSICPGDHVVVITAQQHVNDLSDIFM